MSRKRGSTLSRVAGNRQRPSRVAYGRSSFPSRSTTRVENERPSPSGGGPREAIQHDVVMTTTRSVVDAIARLSLRSRRERSGHPLSDGERVGVRGFGQTRVSTAGPTSPQPSPPWGEGARTDDPASLI